MDVKVDGSEKEDLLNKVINAGETGFDDISFKKAEKALKDALITYVGTDKTYARPLDKINSKLKELKDDFKKIEEKRLKTLEVEENLNNSISLLKEYKKQRDLLSSFIEIVDIIKIINENEKIYTELQEINDEILKIRYKNKQKVVEVYENIDKLNYEYENCKNEMQNCDIEYNKKQRFKKTIDDSLITSIAALAIAGVVSIILNLSNIKSIFDITDFFRISILAVDIFSFIISAILLLAKKKITKKIKNLFNKRNNYEERLRLLRDKLEQFKLTNNNLSNTIEYLIKRASVLTGISVVYTDDNNIIEKEMDKIYNQTSELINDVKTGINENKATENKIDQKAKWIETLSDIINKKTISRKIISKTVYDKVENDEIKIGVIESEIMKNNTKLNEDIYNLSLEIKEYETIIATSDFSNDQLQEVTENMQDLEDKKDNLLKLKFSLSKALEVITSASAEIKKDYMPILNKKMSYYIKSLTDNKYFDLRSNDKLELMVLTSETSKVVPIVQLSNGTIDQAYLSLRLALSDIFSLGGEKLPLIMDEVFAQYDDNRVEAALNMLKEISKERQVFMFTCKKREVEIAREVFKEKLNLIYL